MDSRGITHKELFLENQNSYEVTNSIFKLKHKKLLLSGKNSQQLLIRIGRENGIDLEEINHSIIYNPINDSIFELGEEEKESALGFGDAGIVVLAQYLEIDDLKLAKHKEFYAIKIQNTFNKARADRRRESFCKNLKKEASILQSLGQSAFYIGPAQLIDHKDKTPIEVEPMIADEEEKEEEKYYHGPASNDAILIMPYHEGMEVKTFLESEKDSYMQRLKISIAAINALIQLHNHNITHLDFNTKNMIFNFNTGEINLVDFELSLQNADDIRQDILAAINFLNVCYTITPYEHNELLYQFLQDYNSISLSNIVSRLENKLAEISISNDTIGMCENIIEHETGRLQEKLEKVSNRDYKNRLEIESRIRNLESAKDMLGSISVQDMIYNLKNIIAASSHRSRIKKNLSLFSGSSTNTGKALNKAIKILENDLQDKQHTSDMQERKQ